MYLFISATLPPLSNRIFSRDVAVAKQRHKIDQNNFGYSRACFQLKAFSEVTTAIPAMRTNLLFRQPDGFHQVFQSLVF